MIDFIFEFLVAIILEPILELMTVCVKNKTKINKTKATYIVITEALILLILFVVGGVILLETDGNSLLGKIMLSVSVLFTAVQILFGTALKISKSRKNR